MNIAKSIDYFIQSGFKFFIIDGRLYVKNTKERYYEYLNVKTHNYQLRAGDILEYVDIKYCEEVILLPTSELVVQYILMSDDF